MGEMIMGAKHTPGPWRSWKPDGEAGPDYAKYWVGPVDPKAGHVTAECRDFHVAGDTETVNRANARLIAAAPDLLQACRGIVWLLNLDEPNGPLRIDRNDVTVRMAVDAIAKAT